MINGLYMSASGALMESARHSVISNNLANVNTTGFRDDLAVVRARDAEAVEAGLAAYATPMDAMGGGALLSATYTRHAQGPISITGNALDLAISGEGFFPVSDGSGIQYTRAGAFMRDKVGRLVMADGEHYLCDASGKPVTVPVDADIAVANDGTITANGLPAAKLDLVSFSDLTLLEKAGANVYVNNGAGVTTLGAGIIKSGALEASAVSPAAELTKMILASRGYEMNMQMIRMQDQSLADLVSIGRVSV